MNIRCGHELHFDMPAPTPMLLMLYSHPSRAAHLVAPECLVVEPYVSVNTHLDMYGNRCARIVAPAGPLRIFSDFTVSDPGYPDPKTPDAIQHNVCDVPPDAMHFLMASRYCEVDRLSEIATQLFGATQPGWYRVQAICDWVHNNVTFGYQFARPTKSAYDVYVERTGVCRDFNHLAITFCRCMGIPARYATGYLGDIGIPALPAPMDFSAWFEAYLGNQWHTFDARFNVPRIGRVLMARGRDAVDAALTTSFGHANLKGFRVWANEVP